MSYRLWYWPNLPGRGEFIRLPMEAAGIAYSEPAREAEDGFAAVIAFLGGMEDRPARAVPVLETGQENIAQTPNILAFLGEEHGIGPSGTRERRYLNQIQLDIADFVEEVHLTHHPIAVMLYYEDQKAEAARNAEAFRHDRIPAYLGYFEKAARANGGDWLVGDRWSCGDTSVALLLAGMDYAFPQRMAALSGEFPKLQAIRQRVFAMPGIAAYRASPRCQKFGMEGIFRHYPELDAA